MFSSIFRLLTPEEISELTTSSQIGVRVSLTKLVRDYFKGVVCDFSDKNFHEVGARILTHPKFSGQDLNSANATPEIEAPEFETEELETEDEKVPEFYGQNFKIQEMLKHYKKSSALASSNQYFDSGILVNKKHY